jgi:hypothetical protein
MDEGGRFNGKDQLFERSKKPFKRNVLTVLTDSKRKCKSIKNESVSSCMSIHILIVRVNRPHSLFEVALNVCAPYHKAFIVRQFDGQRVLQLLLIDVCDVVSECVHIEQAEKFA